MLLCAAGCRQAQHDPSAQGDSHADIILLTTNDLHGRLEPFATQTQRGSQTAGGFAALAARMDGIAQQEHSAVVRLNSGDTLTGPYAIHFGGEALFGGLGLMGIDAAVPGNHEFDRGPQELARALAHCQFPMVATNLDIPPGHALADRIQPLLVLDRDGTRLLIAGFVTPELAQIASPGPDIRMQDPTSPHMRQRIIDAIRQHEPDLVIALTHLGLAEDRRLARHIPELDVICGGHSHDLLPPGQEIRIRHAGRRQTVIVQAGYGGSALGVLRIRMSADSQPEYAWLPQALDSSSGQSPRMQEFIARYRALLPASRVLTLSETPIDCRAATLRSREAPIGNCIADSLREYFHADVALYNGGGIRGDCVLPAGSLTSMDIETMLPFGNTAVIVSMTGEVLRQALERSAAQLPRPWGGFLQVSGLRVRIGPRSDSKRRITGVDVLAPDGTVHPLDSQRQYRVATNSFLARGGNGYAEFSQARSEPSADAAVRDIVMRALAAQPRLTPATDGRISMTGG
jgi:5'-nucleotidase